MRSRRDRWRIVRQIGTRPSRREPSLNEQDDVASLCANIAVAVVGHGDLDAAIADLHRLPPGLQARDKLAAGLLEALMRTDPMSDPRRLRTLDGLLEIADGPRPPTPQWIRTRTAAQIMSFMRAVAEGELTDPDVATTRLDALAREDGADPALKPLFDGAYTMLRFARSIHEGDIFALTRLPDEVRQLLDGMPRPDPRLQSLGDVLITAVEFMAANQRGDDITAGVRQVMQAAEGLPPGDLRDMTDDATSTLLKLMGMTADGGDQRLTDEQWAQLQARAEQPGLDGSERARRHTTVAAAALWGWQETDIGRIESGITHLRQALTLGDPGDSSMRVFHLSGLALGLMRHSELTNATADLWEARTLLEEARTLAGGPRHPQWQMLNEMLTSIRRLLGDSEDFHRSALEGLRARVWQVLVQPELAGAILAVRGAATDAVETARNCLVANDLAGAISALDAGRGLALFAATEIRTIADRLDEAGDLDLAQRWRIAAAAHDPAQLPPDLRREVLTVLSAHSSAAALLDPPELGEIQQALAAVDADALVYLVPGAGVIPGYAVVAPATGPPSFLALPNLQVKGDPDIERYLTTLARRDAAALGSSRTLGAARDLVPEGDTVDDAELAGSLDTLCGWAWGAAMGPLIESYLSRMPRLASGRPHRVVLVPMSDLARIPWQAARRKDGKYAIELIAISQAASARMLCRSAALPPVPPSPVGLLVGDPDTTDPTTGEVAVDLGAARLEAYAIRQTFYRGARYIGRRPDGSASPSGDGTSDQVRDWLTASGPAAGAMLHLACHGFVQTGTDQATAYLLLAGGEKLTAEELIALMARAPDREIGLVVLAACRTGLSFNGYDEAYSLGTAFLAGGVRSVLSTQWSIPDRDTSVLMFMFHYFLRTGGRTAWEALREAQLWMLDPHRVVPDEMPSPLRRQLNSADLGAVVAWAAFVHWGQ